jgi:hypothetical protein
LTSCKREPRFIAVLKMMAEMSRCSEKRGRSTPAPPPTWALIGAAVDPRIALQPKNIMAQMGGAMIFGLGAALIEQVNLTDRVSKESNFHDYRVTQMPKVPPVEIKVISTDNPPTGLAKPEYRWLGRQLRKPSRN